MESMVSQAKVGRVLSCCASLKKYAAVIIRQRAFNASVASDFLQYRPTCVCSVKMTPLRILAARLINTIVLGCAQPILEFALCAPVLP